ncbi:MAG: hypothetical protein AB7O48_04000 [Cyclobacteriaceae bacterium]
MKFVFVENINMGYEFWWDSLLVRNTNKGSLALVGLLDQRA